MPKQKKGDALFVQAGGDVAILTFNCVSHETNDSTAWSCIELYRRMQSRRLIIEHHGSNTLHGYSHQASRRI